MFSNRLHNFFVMMVKTLLQTKSLNNLDYFFEIKRYTVKKNKIEDIN